MQGCFEQDCRSVGRKDANVDRGAQTADVKKTAQVRATFIQPLSTTSNWNASMEQVEKQPVQTTTTTQFNQQLKEDEEQQRVQTAVDEEQPTEDRLAGIAVKLQRVEQLLAKQRSKGTSLEMDLATAQEKIKGMERRAQQVEKENVQLKSALQRWNNQCVQETSTLIQQERQTDGRSPLVYSVPVNAATMPQVIPLSVSSVGTMQKMASSTIHAAPVLAMPNLSSPLVSAKTAITAPPLSDCINCENERSEVGKRKAECTNLQSEELWKNRQNRDACVGEERTGRDCYPTSSTFQQNAICGQSDGRMGVSKYAEISQQTRPASPLFKFKLKPKEPPVYCGTADEDIDTWLTKVFDYISLIEANDCQQVAYMATLLQDAAADWWAALMKERKGSRPVDYSEMAVLLQRRFGSANRVERARAALHKINQQSDETVRSYAMRFESLLAKLPSIDGEWAKTQFTWGLHARIAKLVFMSESIDLHQAIQQAEKLEMAQGSRSSQRHPLYENGIRRRRRGQNTRGRKRFGAVQRHIGPIQIQFGQPVQHQSVIQCFKCQGWGHMAHECPSRNSVQMQFQNSGDDREAGNVNSDQKQWLQGQFQQRKFLRKSMQKGKEQTSVMTSLTASGLGASAPPPQVQHAAPVPMPPGLGN